ncbi:MAG: PD-(D/E)XK nuclease family protein, partial [Bacillota bacterium]
MATQSISVRNLVSFLYGTGNLESQTKGKKNRQVGQMLHLERQRTYLEQDKSEVTLKKTFQDSDFTLHLKGRLDGLLNREGEAIIEEIKSTETSLKLMNETTYPAHMMQARFYAYMYMEENALDTITIWLTYIHHPTKAIKTIEKDVTFKTVEEDVLRAVKAYKKWLVIYETHQFDKEKSLEGLTFPHDTYREGQYHFMGAVYKTLISEDILYATAPTGIGKTIGALFSGLKTLKDEKEKLFFLTAKNAG